MAHELDTARLLAKADRRKPSQSHLKRALSAVYYTLFDALARQAADSLVGKGTKRKLDAWRRIYRTIEHGRAREVLKRVSRESGWSPHAQRFAHEFVRAQELRHMADYDPGTSFTRQEVVAAIANAESAVKALERLGDDERLELVTRCLCRERP